MNEKKKGTHKRLRAEQREKRDQAKRIYRMHDLVAMYGLSKPTIYRMINAGQFPRPVQIGDRAVGWLAPKLERWEQELEEAV